jgi:predicted Zn-dependent peptidase
VTASPADLRPRPELGSPVAWRFPDFAETTLGNGIRLLTLHRPGKQVATVAAVLDIPADSDPAGGEGTASIAARSLSEGTESLTVDEFADALERNGANFGADAGYSGLSATLDVPVSRLASALPLMCDAVTRPAFPPVEVERLTRQRLAEIVRERSNPPSRASVEFGAALHAPGTRRALPTAGSEATVSGLTVAGVAAHYGARASAATATVLVAGDLSGLDVEALVAEGFGAWTGAAAALWTPTEPATVPGPRSVVVDRPDSVQTQIVIGHGAPDRRSPDWAAAALAAYAVGGALTSRIDAVLREEKGYTYGMRARFAPDRRGGTFTVSGSFDTQNTEPALDDLARILREAVAEGLRQDERDAASEYLAGVSPTRWETPESLVRQAATLVGCDLPVSWVNGYLTGLREATLDEVNAALRAHVRPDELVVVAVGAAAEITGPLERLGFGTPVVLPA